MDTGDTDSGTLPNAQPVADAPTIVTPLAETTAPARPSKPSKPRKPRRRGRWIALSIILLLLIILGAAGGVGYFAYQQYPALNAIGTRFCDDLLNQKYGDAYSLLSSRLRQRYSQAVFVSMSQTLDSTEGKVTFCGQDASNSFHVAVFPLAITVATDLTRATLGKRQGSVKLVYENGHWLVDNISTSLMGVNIDGLLTAESLCAVVSLQATTDAAIEQKYANIWALYGSAARAQTTEADFLEVGLLHDHLDGKVEECSITSIGKANTDTLTQVTYTAKHTYSVETQAPATLRLQNGDWKFSALDASVYGRDMAPAQVATRWLAAMASGDCSSAYADLSADAQKRISLAAFTSRICDAPVEWYFYNLDPTAYVEESSAKYTVDLMTISYHQLAQLIATDSGLNPDAYYSGNVTLIYSGGSWWVDGLVVK